MLSLKQLNKRPAQSSDAQLGAAKRKIYQQLGLMVFTITVTVVLMFAMTTAWQTNVVQTQGLTFQAEAWGFRGGVTIQSGTILASPGDKGVIAMEVTNEGDEASAITAMVSKNTIAEPALRQRIYFYVDEAATLNGETVQRQYLTQKQGYTYEVNRHNTLLLSELLCTDVPLQWMWVYDVVGYYFQGSQNADNSFAVTEYLRPVEYDCYEARYDANGYVTMVDANTTVDAFLTQVTASDGYSGTYTKVTDNCYQIVPATETEEAIWLYLCTKSEIEANTAWDTAYAKQEIAQRKFSAKITLTGQQIVREVVSVSEPAALGTALNGSNGKVLQLQQDMTLPAAVDIAAGTEATLDLNGHTITYTGDGAAFRTAQGGSLTVSNGSAVGNGSNTVFQTMGGQVSVSALTVSNVYSGIEIEDYKSTSAQGANSVVRLDRCQWTCDDTAVYVTGDGSLSSAETKVIIQNCTLISENYIALCGNGTAGNGTAANPGRWGSDIQVINSTLSGYYAGIFHPMQQSTLTVTSSTVSGNSGIAIKGGTVIVSNSTVSGTEVGNNLVDPETTPAENSGYLDTGDGIYVEGSYGYPIHVAVMGSSRVSCAAPSAKAVRHHPVSQNTAIQITGGTFSTDISSYVPQGYTCQSTSDGYLVSPEQ
ncbi:MAG: hypothetical protein E7446_04735 [Ruminococcaceae bacterium]|nr:hypothetical protein [Oscillospiraceae bacterium]